ncbi:Pleckstrin homology domain-containing protein, partial [Crepidotus variabilis]
MLVRIDYTESEAITRYDDNINRTTRDLDFQEWGEFLVVWRKDSIEVYRDHATPGKEWVTGHKHLSYVIPLRSSRTRLSLYSFVDLSFCITCAPTTTSLDENATRWIFRREKHGTNIFIFQLKSRSRAYDWYWQLWRQMGGVIPRSMEVYNPRLNTKVTIDIPDADGTNSAGLYRVFRRENIIQLCMESLEKVPDYKYLVENAVLAGKTVQLAWRYQTNLDWVWLDDDVFGEARDWAVLCGLAFKQATRTPSLEIRLAEHAPNFLHLKDGRRIDEPAAIEGYLDRIRPNTQTKHQVYLSTHSGYLFILNSSAPFPPTPPGIAPISSSIYSDAQTLKHAETRRGINQIVTSTSMMDLRTIVAVRRAKTSDKGQMKMRRSFELLLNTGHVMRFEAYSAKVGVEWIERLRALIFYWKRRHRADAKQEIELAQAQRPRLTPQTRVRQDDHAVPPEAPADLSAPYAAVDSLYNWCILEGCKPIVKSGRIYMRKGIRGQFNLVQLFLVAGHLVRFKIKGHSSVYPAVKKKINLLDAYVCSGYFAAQALPKGEYKPNTPPTARRYGDGLETDDRDEDIMFNVWYRSQPQMLGAEKDPTTTPVDDKSIPKLSNRLKVLIFKTRSVLERDAWCWAINSEIEKIMRTQSQREMKLRDTGKLVKL